MVGYTHRQQSHHQHYQHNQKAEHSHFAMDMDTGNPHRNKYSQNTSTNNSNMQMQPAPRQHGHPSSSGAARSSLREDPDPSNGRSRSARSSSRDARRSRSRKSHSSANNPNAPSSSAMQYQQQPPSRRSSNPSSTSNGYSQQQPPPPQQQTPMSMPNNTHMAFHKNPGTPNPDSLQPAFPPPAVTNNAGDSPTTMNYLGGETLSASQRRPAYLLHRDLVIGKGSYGQVCIASRGEPEGHTSSHRSGKRKKFACKCVMLRNDPKYIAKLQEEVNVLRELRGHDNVIRLYDVFCVDNELFIITELGRGGDLFHLLTTHPKHGVTESYAGTY